MEIKTPLTEKMEEALDKLGSISSEISDFFKYVPDLCCVFSVTSQFIRVSHSVNTILGYTEDEFCNINLMDIIHPDDIDKTKMAVADLTVGGSPIVIVNRHRHKDGHYVTLAWNSSRIDANGKSYAIARDISHLSPDIIQKLTT